MIRRPFALTLATCARRRARGRVPPTPDVYFEQTTVTRADGQPGGPGVRRGSGSRDGACGSRAKPARGPAFLLQLDVGQAFRLDPERKVAIQIDLARLRNRAADGRLRGQRPHGQRRGGRRADCCPRRPAHHRRLPLPRLPAQRRSLTLDVYMASEVPVGIDAFADLVEWSGASQAMAGFLAEMRKLRGFPLETRARVSVRGQTLETVSTITKVLIGPQPRALFEPPVGLADRARGAARNPDRRSLMGILLSIVGNAIALLATTVVPGITLQRELAHPARGRDRLRPVQPDRAADRLLPLPAPAGPHPGALLLRAERDPALARAVRGARLPRHGPLGRDPGQHRHHRS